MPGQRVVNWLSIDFMHAVIVVFFIAIFPVFKVVGLVKFLFFPAIAGCIVLWFVFMVLYYDGKVLCLKDFFPYLLFFMALALSVIPALSKLQCVIDLVAYFAWIWIAFMAGQRAFLGKKMWLVIAVVLLVISIFLINVVIYIKFGTVRQTSADMTELVGFFGNVGSAIVVTCLPFMFYAYVQRKISRSISVFIIFLAFAVIGLSQSRGALIFSLLSIFLSILFASKGIVKFFKNVLFSAVGVLIISSTLFYSNENFSNFINITVSRIVDSRFVSGDTEFDGNEVKNDIERIIMFETAAVAVAENPVMGIGYSCFPYFMEKKVGKYQESHSLLITVFAEAGVIGLVCYIYFLFECVTRLMRTRKKYLQFWDNDNYLFYPMVLASLIVGVMNALIRVPRNNPILFMNYGIALVSLSEFSFRKKKYINQFICQEKTQGN